MAKPENLSENVKKTIYWSRVGIGVRKGLKMHQLSGQLSPDHSWRNVTEHCLVQVARAEVLARWIGLPEDIIADIKKAEILEDFSKKQEIESTRQAEEKGESPLQAYKKHTVEAVSLLRKAGFSKSVIYFASAPGGHVEQLLETRKILCKDTLNNKDWGYLLTHIVDDYSVRSDCVRPSEKAPSIFPIGRRNIIDFKSEENRNNPAYKKILAEIGEELKATPFEGKHNQDVMVAVSHGIERRLAQRIFKRTGEIVNPFEIPELVDQEIREAIENIT